MSNLQARKCQLRRQWEGREVSESDDRIEAARQLRQFAMLRRRVPGRRPVIPGDFTHACEIGADAIERIEEVEAENARLRQERDHWKRVDDVREPVFQKVVEQRNSLLRQAQHVDRQP